MKRPLTPEQLAALKKARAASHVSPIAIRAQHKNLLKGKTRRKPLKPLVFLAAVFLCTGLCHAQITLVDNPKSPWSNRVTSGKLTISQAVTVSSPADMFILDVQTLGNSNWTGVNLYLDGTPLVQASGWIPAAGTKVDTAVYYLANPPTGGLTLTGTFGTANAGIANYYSLTGVNTAAAIVASSASSGTSPTVSLSLATSAGAWAAISQATFAGPDAGTYSATSGNAASLTAGSVYNLFRSDGYAKLSGPSDTLTATVDLSSATIHSMAAAVFIPTVPPPYGPPTWTAGSGSWSNGGNWSSSPAPNAAGVRPSSRRAGQPRPR